MNIVEQLYDGIKSIAQAELGAGWAELRRILAPEQNDLVDGKPAFGVKYGSAAEAAGVTRVYTMDHSFEILLAKYVPPGNDDEARQDVFAELYNAGDEIFRQLLLQKVGLPAIVLNVQNPSISEPVILGNDTALIRFGVVIKYRNAVNL